VRNVKYSFGSMRILFYKIYISLKFLKIYIEKHENKTCFAMQRGRWEYKVINGVDKGNKCAWLSTRFP
jgi:hypothetical protein